VKSASSVDEFYSPPPIPGLKRDAIPKGNPDRGDDPPPGRGFLFEDEAGQGAGQAPELLGVIGLEPTVATPLPPKITWPDELPVKPGIN